MADQPSFRYPGVQPFRASERHIFFGRDEDIENLYDLILLEKLVVLFGKSGYGKSSLLSAGVLPRFTQEGQPAAFRFRPVEVRFGSYQEGISFAPLETVRRILEKEMPASAPAPATLWQWFKARQEAAGGQFVLVFDQFEEFFTYPAAQQQEFRRQLAELLFTQLPQYARDAMDSMDEAGRSRLAQPMNIKAVIAIRSDRMSLLDSMKDALPTILHRRYELRALTREQAGEAIVKPASRRDARFITPPFEYQPAAIRTMLDALLTSEGGGKAGVEAFLLQILCEHVEDLVKKGAVPDLDGNGLPDVTPAQLPDMSNLLGSYLHRKITELDPAARPVARRLLEDGLLAEDPATGESRRTSVDGQSLLGQFRKLGLTQTILDDLEKNYLVRREPNTVGGFSYEISHDRLMEPVQKMKAGRQKKLAAQRQRRLAGFVALALVVAASAVGFGAWAFNQRDAALAANEKTKAALEKAEQQRIEADSAKADALRQKDFAEKKKAEADSATVKAIRQEEMANRNLAELKKAQAAKLAQEIDQYLASAKRMIELGDIEMANSILDEAARLAKNNPDLLQKIKENRPK